MNDREAIRYEVFGSVVTFGKTNATGFAPTSEAAKHFTNNRRITTDLDHEKSNQTGGSATAKEVQNAAPSRKATPAAPTNSAPRDSSSQTARFTASDSAIVEPKKVGGTAMSKSIKIMNHSFAYLSLPILLFAGLLPAQNANQTAPRKAAIFVENRAGAALNDKVPVLDDFLTSKITEKGFSVISREVAINALKTYSTSEITASTAKATKVEVSTPKGQGEVRVDVANAAAAQISATAGSTALDRLLSDNTSALRLAQNLGADYLLVASITTFAPPAKQTSSELGTVIVTHTLRVSYKVLEGVQGSSLIGTTVTATKKIRLTADNQTENPDIINELLEDAATQVAEDAGKKLASIAVVAAQPKQVEIFVSCAMQDLVQLPLLTDIRVLDDGSLVVTTNRIGIQVLNASVLVDGFSIGSAPGKFKVSPGSHIMRITRAGFNDHEERVTFTDGQRFENVALQMSEAGYARWKDNTTFLFAIKTGEKMTDGVREMMGGLAQTFRQSGYRVDSKTDIKATIETKGKSLFDGVTFPMSLFNKSEK